MLIKKTKQSNSGWEKLVWISQGGGSMNLMLSHFNKHTSVRKGICYSMPISLTFCNPLFCIQESLGLGLGALTVERSFFAENERNDQENKHLERILKNIGTISKRTEWELLEKND